MINALILILCYVASFTSGDDFPNFDEIINKLNFPNGNNSSAADIRRFLSNIANPENSTMLMIDASTVPLIECDNYTATTITCQSLHTVSNPTFSPPPGLQRGFRF